MGLDPKDAKILIIVTHGPESPHRAPGSFLFAQQAAAMGSQVSMCFVLQAPLLLKKGVGETLYGKEDGRSVSRFIHETLEAGVGFYVCDAALELCDMTPDDLIEEVENLVGPSFVISQGLESDLVLNF